ncbi:hypothetical protein [Brevibacillus fulvus]|uniref:Ribosomal protein L36 n=1 Tax=Brevibacillus fulvus TaxID=1125967 RepID=A0A938XY27_9BACL|nr:hypothetical protein [Brevibacillus fulvus]MBM7588561.1 ribosomal protein L36 [Brevibacillus fulvus]
MNRIPALIIWIILGLAAYGFLLTLINNPIDTLLIIAMSALLIYFVRNYLRTGRFLPKWSAFKGKNTYQTKSLRSSVKKTSKTSKTERREHPFRVIEGYKGKRKNRQNDQDSNILH